MLLFVIGTELDLKTFRKHIFLSSVCVILQISVGLLASFVISLFFNWPAYFTIALGFVMSLSSTAVVVNMLESFELLNSKTGAITVGILIAQDIAVVPMLLILKMLTSDEGRDWTVIAEVLLAVVFIALLFAFLDRPQNAKRRQLIETILGKHRDLYMLTSLSLCFALATISEAINLAAPYGAFLAGLILKNISDDNTFIESVRPIQKLLLLFFFLSTGLLLDLQFVFHHFPLICLLLIIVTIGKTFANIAILRFLNVKLAMASFMGVIFAQLGEFSFMLTTAFGNSKSASFEFARTCLVALTVLSLMFSPIWLKIAQKLNRAITKANISSAELLSTYVFGSKFFTFLEKVKKDKKE
jgi:CPA2 family monovalent cation:H+ antiporter-2